MSFYLGKDSSSGSLLHITKGVTDEATIKTGAALSTTVYNSKLPLSGYRLIPVATDGYITYPSIEGYISGFNYCMVSTWFLGPRDYIRLTRISVPVTGIMIYSMSSSDYAYFISAVNSKPGKIMFLGSDYKLLPNVSLSNCVSLGGYTSTYGQALSVVPSTSLGLGLVDFQHSVTPIVSYILVVEDSLYPALAGSITVNNSGIFIGGTNALASKNIISTVGNFDSKKVAEGIYLSSTPVGSKGSFSLTNAGYTEIKQGGLIIFDSRVNSYNPFKPHHISNISKSVAFTGGAADTLLYTFSSTDMFCIISVTLDYGERYTSPYVIVSRNSATPILLYTYPWFSKDVLGVYFAQIISYGDRVYIRSRNYGPGATNGSLTWTYKIDVY